MKKWWKQLYDNSSLVAKIRYSYVILSIPFIIFFVFCLENLRNINQTYGDMINSTVVASEFSLDFKKDFDYETYLLIAGNKSLEESKLRVMLQEANRIVDNLQNLTKDEDNQARLKSVEKYLSNMDTYVERIEKNLEEGNKYEDNIEIWENDIQIVSSLVGESISQYIYYEVKGIQESHDAYQKFFINIIRISLVVFALLLVLITVLSFYIPRSITKPIRKLSEITDQVAKGNLSVRSSVKGGAEVGQLSDSFNSMIDKINELLTQVTTEQIRLRKAEFELLQSQINPHFLYNTLDAIVWLAESGEQKKVVSMVGSLSEFFRTSLNQGKDIVSIKEELQHVKSYLEIQQTRYQDIMEYEIEDMSDLNSYHIPKITIQPLVENALYHGIKNKRGQGKIRVYGKLMDSYFLIFIEDNGIGITEERLLQVQQEIEKKDYPDKDIYGLYNVNERIRLNFGEEYGIRIESVYGEGTKVTIKLPC